MFLKICNAILEIFAQVQHGTFCGFGKVTERFFDSKFGLLKIFFEEGKVVGIGGG